MIILHKLIVGKNKREIQFFQNISPVFKKQEI